MKSMMGSTNSTIPIYCDIKASGKGQSSSGVDQQKFLDIDKADDLRGKWLINIPTVESHKVIAQDFNNNSITITTKDENVEIPLHSAIQNLKIVDGP